MIQSKVHSVNIFRATSTNAIQSTFHKDINENLFQSKFHKCYLEHFPHSSFRALSASEFRVMFRATSTWANYVQSRVHNWHLEHFPHCKKIQSKVSRRDLEHSTQWQVQFRATSTIAVQSTFRRSILEQSAQISFRALSTRDNYDLEQSALSSYIQSNFPKSYLEHFPQGQK